MLTFIVNMTKKQYVPFRTKYTHIRLNMEVFTRLAILKRKKQKRSFSELINDMM